MRDEKQVLVSNHLKWAWLSVRSWDGYCVEAKWVPRSFGGVGSGNMYFSFAQMMMMMMNAYRSGDARVDARRCQVVSLNGFWIASALLKAGQADSAEQGQVQLRRARTTRCKGRGRNCRPHAISTLAAPQPQHTHARELART